MIKCSRESNVDESKIIKHYRNNEKVPRSLWAICMNFINRLVLELGFNLHAIEVVMDPGLNFLIQIGLNFCC